MPAMWLALSALLLGLGEARRQRHGASGDRLATASGAGGMSYGNPECPCIGIGNVEGTLYVDVGNSTTAEYPADMGSHCAAWDDGRDTLHCLEGQSPGKGASWCAQRWCYVDPCQCKGIVPTVTKSLYNVVHHGEPVYYSYETCGGKDEFTDENHKDACTVEKTEKACVEKDCSWHEVAGGSGKYACMAWEAAGLCGDMPDEDTWGKKECPCIHMMGLNGTLTVDLGEGETAQYPAEVGSMCKPWDLEHSTHCKGDTKASGCNQPWCFVDSAKCSEALKPATTTYLPGSVYQGRPLAYSYLTCGGTMPSEPPQGTARPEAAGALPEAAAEAENGEEKSQPVESPPVEYDHDAYEDEWHQEWRNGDHPSFEDLHPEFADPSPESR